MLFPAKRMPCISKTWDIPNFGGPSASVVVYQWLVSSGQFVHIFSYAMVTLDLARPQIDYSACFASQTQREAAGKTAPYQFSMVYKNIKTAENTYRTTKKITQVWSISSTMSFPPQTNFLSRYFMMLHIMFLFHFRQKIS